MTIKKPVQIHNYKCYELEVTFDSSVQMYEGVSPQTNIYFLDSSLSQLHDRFHDYVDRIQDILEYKGVELIVSTLPDSKMMVGDFRKPSADTPIFFGTSTKKIQRKFEKYVDKLEKFTEILKQLKQASQEKLSE